MTLSARASTLDGIIRPICLVVLRLIISSKLIRFIYGYRGRHGTFKILFTKRRPGLTLQTDRPVEHQTTGDNKISAAVGSSLPL